MNLNYKKEYFQITQHFKKLNLNLSLINNYFVILQ